MRTISNKQAVTVGIFILLGVLIFLLGVFTLGGSKSTFEKRIRVKAVFDDVSGLQAGNNVWFSGVKVGTVKEMKFHPNAQVEVLLNINQEAEQYIRKDAKAKISSEGLMGNKIVVIYGGSLQSPAIEADDVLGVEKGMSMDDIMASFKENSSNLLQITNDFKLIS